MTNYTHRERELVMSNEPHQQKQINERVASLEASNEFNKEQLQEIANTLKKVVETQAMLANQRNEIIKVADLTQQLSVTIHEHDKRIENAMYRTEQLEEATKTFTATIEATKQESEHNSQRWKTATGIVTVVAVPLAIMVLKGLMGW